MAQTFLMVVYWTAFKWSLRRTARISLGFLGSCHVLSGGHEYAMIIDGYTND